MNRYEFCVSYVGLSIQLGRYQGVSGHLPYDVGFRLSCPPGSRHMQESLEPQMWCACRVYEIAYLNASLARVGAVNFRPQEARSAVGPTINIAAD